MLGPASTNLVAFLLKMREEARKIAMTANLLSQMQVLKKLNKEVESKQTHLTDLWESYSRADNPISSKELLKNSGI
jgi:transposase-like protein